MTEQKVKNEDLLEKYDPMNETLREAAKTILKETGNDVDREGLLDTPDRVARLWRELFQGLDQDPGEVLSTTFTTNSDSMVVVKDIPFYSVCEHHLVPFHGVAHVGYVPGPADGEDLYSGEFKIVGLSKFARLVDILSRRPQVQENLTAEIANEIDAYLQPQGVIVVMKAEHLCMGMRGVRKPGSTTVTSSVSGLFDTNADGVKDEFFRMLDI